MKYIFLILCLLTLTEISAKTKVGVIGDSISCDAAVEKPYHKILAEHYDWEVVNLSVGGSMTITLRDRLLHLLEDDEIKLIIIALGINDAGQNKSAKLLYGRLANASEICLRNGVKLLIGSVDVSSTGWHSQGYCNGFIHAYYTLEKREYPNVQVFPFLTTELLTNPIYFSPGDGGFFHPNQLGHEKISQKIMETLESS